MKRNVAVLVALIWSCLTGFAQGDAAAKKLLDQVSKKYDAYTTIQSNFTFSAKQTQGDAHQEKGVLFLNKPKNQYRIQLNSQDLISDGKTLWSVLKTDKEVQIGDAESGTETSIGPSTLFTFYKTGFKYSSKGNERVGSEILNVVELTPVDTRTNYVTIRLRINKNMHIHDVQILDKGGAQYTYTIQTLYVNHRIAPSNFTFNKSDYPSYEIVDLR
ncbi:outer membrane lipoprotein-sorting protein [Sphingobacterium allocomposti]|uniref:Outer membrane lipoprotein-sorting protein n=1 Tax=Sphingobacterium allocomposti TaxID=415956 RepID=A0A5S5CZ41_9SPHI|nr:outer membrane lipoprotein carrier protein LolA [Sphingobacterium composti Yoo et al. 2007 non Ten et al. 2007]TYP88288.1 outer membrane lipoprotein-sorting protein [Sphingobacterium composti Yoo et al. 2007 non Ten et al. 2007]